MHWESKMSTRRWAEVCKVLQNPWAADTKVNIHHVRTSAVFRKLYSIITGEFTHPKDTLSLFLNQIICYYCNHKAWHGAYIPVHPSSWCVCCGHQDKSRVSVQGRPSAESCECPEWWGNRGWEMGMHHSPVQAQSCCSRAGEPSKDLPVISVPLHRSSSY